MTEPEILNLQQIQSLLSDLDLIPLIENGFTAYSQGESVVPPVGELELDKGEVHIKYGFIRHQSYYVIKIASGFYGNTDLGLSTSNGCMLVFSQTTGQLAAVLLDEGHLTDVRTAVAGAIAAKQLAPNQIRKIGIVGTGIQARLQLLYLQQVVDCREVAIWGRSSESVRGFQERLNRDRELGLHDFNIEPEFELAKLQELCQLIVTTTPSRTPLLKGELLRQGTHITAVGSDMPGKQELDSSILQKADVVVADSVEQCLLRGEIFVALRENAIQFDELVELGDVINEQQPGRTSQEQISVCDLTGVAVQDIEIATAVLNQFLQKT